MKISIHIEDTESLPRVTCDMDRDPAPAGDEKSLAYSISVLVRMLLDLLNTEHRADLVGFIGTLHKAHREGNIAGVEVQYGTDSDNPTGSVH